MRTSELHYDLPEALIAQEPVEPRDASRLMVLDRAAGSIGHGVFGDITRYVRAGDCLVLNETKVTPARFFARRATGGRVEGLFLGVDSQGMWEALLKQIGRASCRERV